MIVSRRVTSSAGNAGPAWNTGRVPRRRPSEIRRWILDDHEELRGLVAELNDLLKRAIGGPPDLSLELRETILELHARLGAHLNLKDELLVPALRRSDAVGLDRAKQLMRQHREQRALLASILERLRGDNGPTVLLAARIRGLIEALLDDMAHGKNTILRKDFFVDEPGKN